MNLCKNFILVAIAAIFALSGQVLANKASETRSKSLSSFKINPTNDEITRAAQKTIIDEARQSFQNGASVSALEVLLEGYNSAFDLLAIVWRKLHEALDRTLVFANTDPNAAIDVVSNQAQTILDLIFIKAVPCQRVQGTALSIAGELARPGLREGFAQLQHAGGILLKTINNVRTIAVLGLKPGGKAAKEAIKAAHEVIRSGSSGVYKHVVMSARSAFHGLEEAYHATPQHHTFKLRTLEAEVAAIVPEAQMAIDELKMGYENVLNYLNQESYVVALNEIYHGFISSTIDNAHAIVKAYKIIDEAEQLSSRDTEAALSLLQNGVQDIRNIVLNVTADSVLGIGVANHMLGGEFTIKLAPPLISAVVGRVSLFDELAIAERVATIGLNAGGIVSSQGISAARKIVSAGSRALFSHYIKGGHSAFRAFLTS